MSFSYVNAGGNDSFTTLLLHGDTSFTDRSLSSHTISVNGSATITTSISRFGGGSISFDGSTGYLLLDGSADFAFGTGDFTVEFWARPSSVGTVQTLYDTRFADGAFPNLYLAADATVRYYVNAADQIVSSATLSTGTWYHILLSRAVTSTKLFIGGVQSGSTYNDSNNYTTTTSRPVIAAIGQASPPFANFFSGQMDEIRISKGIARFTSNFSPYGAPYD